MFFILLLEMINGLKIAHLNVRSLTSNFNDFCTLITNQTYNTFAVTETWLSHDIDSNTIKIPNYKFYRCDRTSRRGGVYVADQLNAQVVNLNIQCQSSLEQLWVKIKIKSRIYAIGTLYHPPNTNMLDCIEHRDQSLSLVIPTVDEVVCFGDTNVNLFNLDNALAHCFDSYGFTQSINEPTRITNTSSSLLDPIFISNKEIVISSGTQNADHISDHKIVFCGLKVNIPKVKQKIVEFRDFNKFDYNLFLKDLDNVPLDLILRCPDIDSSVDMLTIFITNLVDLHATIKKERVSKAKAPWFTNNLKMLIKIRDLALVKYKHTRDSNDCSCNQGNIRNKEKT